MPVASRKECTDEPQASARALTKTPVGKKVVLVPPPRRFVAPTVSLSFPSLRLIACELGLLLDRIIKKLIMSCSRIADYCNLPSNKYVHGVCVLGSQNVLLSLLTHRKDRYISPLFCERREHTSGPFKGKQGMRSCKPQMVSLSQRRAVCFESFLLCLQIQKQMENTRWEGTRIWRQAHFVTAAFAIVPSKLLPAAWCLKPHEPHRDIRLQ